MLRDVFYYGNKPNVHPREKFATSLEDARSQCTTEHFWIINEYCDYRNFDWDFDFEFLPDEDVWAEEHNNVWPSQHQKDSGTWLCPSSFSEVIIYRNDVDVVKRKNIKNSNWVLLDLVDETKFDFSWHPDPTDPPYIYTWGCKYFPVELQACLEYHAPNATNVKYMSGIVELLPQVERWIEVQAIDKSKFDLSWRPNPLDPPMNYVWGNKYIAAELKSTVEYHMPGASVYKYMDTLVEVLPELNLWKEVQSIDKTKFDLSWRPDPREPAYIYVWGNKHIPGDLKSTLEYHCPDATEYKYMDELVEVLSEKERWTVLQEVENFDFTWRPDPREPAYIYVWGNKWIPGELKSTVEYHCPGGTERKYMGNIDVLPELKKWKETLVVDKTKFDLSWRPDPREPAYIYVWGNKYDAAEVKPTLEYYVEGATEYKYMGIVDLEPEWDRWKEYIAVDRDSFDFSWRPDPNLHEPPYIYVWGNKYDPAEVKPTLEYHVPGATEYKYMGVVDLAPEWDRWKEYVLVDRDSFDFRWRPDPNLHEPPYIYVWGNKFHPAEEKPTIEYHVPGATEYKYMGVVDLGPEWDKWNILIPIDMQSFDFRWRPDPNAHEPPMIYVFGNKWNDSKTEPTIEYRVPGAEVRKYMDYSVATPKPDMQYWTVNNSDDLETFDFSWRPNPFSPPQIYQWADNGPRYTMPESTDVVYMERTQDTRVVNRYKIKTTLEDLINEHPEEVFWAINPDLNYEKFDFSWRPNEENFRHINVFGNEYSKNTQTYYINGPMFTMGYKEYNYVEDQSIEIDSNLNMFFIDRSNDGSNARFNELKLRYPQLQKTRYLNSWVDTIARCINKSETKLFWVLNSELDYTDFEFDFYPSPWQMKMIHVFGTQWSHWGNTYMINKETFIEDTKYIKIIEHLSNLNFVRHRKAKATNVLYDIVYIDHGNKDLTDITNLIIEYKTSYLNTFRNMLEKLPVKKEHYVWIASTVCDYKEFDFTYICDPFAKEQLHVFPSDKQKFGDTFLVDVNKLRSLIEDMNTLEDYEKINYNQNQRAKRLPAPIIFTESDTHVSTINSDFNFPYATYITTDNKEIEVVDTEPMSLWTPESKTIQITSVGGTRIIVPKEAKEYVKCELYDYPYITTNNRLVKSAPLDIVFFSNGETCADENYEHLLKITRGLPNKIIRIDGINGRVKSQHAAANSSDTPWYFLVNAKLKVTISFDFSWQPDRLQIPKHYIFHATNPVNGLVYGHQAIVANNKKLTLANFGNGLDFTMDSEHEVVPVNSGIGMFNSSEWDTWRTAFRECIKLKASSTEENKERLKMWLTVGIGKFNEFSTAGAQHAIEYYDEVDGDFEKLKLSYDWPWLRAYFDKKYIK